MCCEARDRILPLLRGEARGEGSGTSNIETESLWFEILFQEVSPLCFLRDLRFIFVPPKRDPFALSPYFTSRGVPFPTTAQTAIVRRRHHFSTHGRTTVNDSASRAANAGNSNTERMYIIITPAAHFCTHEILNFSATGETFPVCEQEKKIVPFSAPTGAASRSPRRQPAGWRVEQMHGRGDRLPLVRHFAEAEPIRSARERAAA